MAWQSSGAMGGGGGMVGPGMDGSANVGGHPQGTEYTLQGVMRFLQTEWHRHERDRNAWEIERAEMKSRIGGLEGDARTSKRMQESLGKHVKILESALKREREKVKTMSKGEKLDTSKDPKDVAKDNLKAISKASLKPINTSVESEGENDDPNHPDFRQDTERDKSRIYLGKCSQEVSYHVIPAAHPPPSLDDPPELSNHVYPNQQMPQQSLEEVYVQQRQKQQQNNVPMVREPVLQNHQPMLSTNFENPSPSRPNNQQHHLLTTSRDTDRHTYNQEPPLTAIDGRKPFELPSSSDEQVESIAHAFDSHGKSIPGKREIESIQTTEIPISREESEGWNFDDSPSALEPPPDDPRRDSDPFPGSIQRPPMSPPRLSPGSHRRKSSGARRRSGDGVTGSQEMTRSGSQQADPSFKVRFALRGHLDVVRTVIFTGGGSPSEPEICTSGDDGTIKRWIIPASYGSFGPHGGPQGNDLDITAYFTHRGHNGAVTSLAACPPSPNFSNGGRAMGDGWVFSGGQDATVRVWERGRVDPKATLDGHTDAIWALAVLPGSSASILGERCTHFGGPDRILLASGGSDGRILIWAISAPPQLNSPHTGSRRGAGRRANSVSSGSNFPSSPQPSVATSTPFNYTLVHHIVRANHPSPTCISPLSTSGDTFVVSYTDASILIYDTRSGEEVVGMASLETYDGTPSTGVNSVVASTMGFDASHHLDPGRGLTEDESVVHGATGSSGGVEGVIISGYEDRYIRFFDANSGQCTYTMLAHPAAISSLSLSPDGRELVSAGHDASLRFWSLEKRSCTQEITSHRLMRGEGVCAVVWSQDGRWVVSAGGDGVVKVFAR